MHLAIRQINLILTKDYITYIMDDLCGLNTVTSVIWYFTILTILL